MLNIHSNIFLLTHLVSERAFSAPYGATFFFFFSTFNFYCFIHFLLVYLFFAICLFSLLVTLFIYLIEGMGVKIIMNDPVLDQETCIKGFVLDLQ